MDCRFLLWSKLSVKIENRSVTIQLLRVKVLNYFYTVTLTNKFIRRIIRRPKDCENCPATCTTVYTMVEIFLSASHVNAACTSSNNTAVFFFSFFEHRTGPFHVHRLDGMLLGPVVTSRLDVPSTRFFKIYIKEKRKPS